MKVARLEEVVGEDTEAPDTTLEVVAEEAMEEVTTRVVATIKVAATANNTAQEEVPTPKAQEADMEVVAMELLEGTVKEARTGETMVNQMLHMEGLLQGMEQEISIMQMDTATMEEVVIKLVCSVCVCI